MEWYRDLYLGESVRDKKDQIMQDVEGKRYRGNMCLITLAVNPDNELEILPVRELRYDYHVRNCPLVVGIAGDRKEALKLIQKIAGDVYRSTGDVAIREFFLSAHS